MRGKIPHIVQYQGSKRILAPQILQYMPKRFNRLLEPFSGMAAISIATAYDNRTDEYVINDINAPLIRMLQDVVEHPQNLLDSYSELWSKQFTYGDKHVQHYYDVRERFNNGNNHRQICCISWLDVLRELCDMGKMESSISLQISADMVQIQGHWHLTYMKFHEYSKEK